MGKRFGEQEYLGSFGWTSLNYDWSMVFKATKQTKLLFTQIKPKHSFKLAKKRISDCYSRQGKVIVLEIMKMTQHNNKEADL